jgi:High potential iron-sulfur protein
MPKRSVSRRAALRFLALGATAPAVLANRRSAGAEPIRLDVNDPAALALGYVENATAVDVSRYPAYVHGSNCDNCLQLQGSPGSDYRPCGLFPGKLVSVRGWCSRWTAEM